jgi:hypothetical protein
VYACAGPYGVKAIAVGSGGSLEMHGGKGVPPLPLGLQDKGVEGINIYIYIYTYLYLYLYLYTGIYI